MASYIALLRGINVGGNNMVAMSALKEMCASIGFASAQTLLHSGNLIFEGKARKAEGLEQLLEKETEKYFGVQADYFVRTAEEWRETLAHNPFAREAKSDPGRLLVMVLKAAPDVEQVKALRGAIKGREIFETWKRQGYFYYPDGSGNSKLTPRLIESKLGTRATGRNWNTALKI